MPRKKKEQSDVTPTQLQNTSDPEGQDQPQELPSAAQELGQSGTKS